MRDTLHWIPIRQRIFYRVAVLVPGVALSSRHCPSLLAGTHVSPCIDPGWTSSASFLFRSKTLSSPCKNLRAGKNLRFLKQVIRFFRYVRFLGFNVYAQSTSHAEHCMDT